MAVERTTAAERTSKPGPDTAVADDVAEPIPRRVQRLRKAGSKLPDNTVVVTRPGKFGNPFTLFDSKNVAERQKVVDQFELWLTSSAAGRLVLVAAKRELRGKNLACWCNLHDVCHADVLLRLCNPQLAQEKPKPPVLMAATRDASFYNSPGVAKRYHVIGPHADHRGQRRDAACGKFLLVLESSIPIEAVAPELRCQHLGCKHLWPRQQP